MKHRISDIIACAAEIEGVPAATLLSASRTREHSHVRAIIIREARRSGYSYPQIGAALKRDHSSIVHGARMWASYVRQSPDLVGRANAVSAALSVLGPFVEEERQRAAIANASAVKSRLDREAVIQIATRQMSELIRTERQLGPPGTDRYWRANVIAGSKMLLQAVRRERRA